MGGPLPKACRHSFNISYQITLWCKFNIYLYSHLACIISFTLTTYVHRPKSYYPFIFHLKWNLLYIFPSRPLQTQTQAHCRNILSALQTFSFYVLHDNCHASCLVF